MSSLGKVQLCMCLVFGGERVGGNYCYIMEDSFFSLQTHKQVGELQFYGVEVCLKKDCIFVSMENPEFQ